MGHALLFGFFPHHNDSMEVHQAQLNRFTHALFCVHKCYWLTLDTRWLQVDSCYLVSSSICGMRIFPSHIPDVPSTISLPDVFQHVQLCFLPWNNFCAATSIFCWSLFHLDEGGLNISGSGGVAAPTRPLNLCFGGGVERCDFLENFNWSWSIRQPVLFTGRNFFFFHSRLPLCFFQGRNIHAMITFTEEGTLKQRIQETYLQQGFHSSRVASCYQVLRMLFNQTRDVKSRHDSFPLRAKVDETGQLLVLTWW